MDFIQDSRLLSPFEVVGAARSNSRPTVPKTVALPGCATPRESSEIKLTSCHCWTKNSYLSRNIIPRVHSSSHFSSWAVHYLKYHSFSSLQIRKTEMPKDLHVEKDVFMRLINICEAKPL